MRVEDFKDILYAKDESTGIVTVTLNTPKRKNALSFVSFLGLYYAAEEMEKDDTARALIITGARIRIRPIPGMRPSAAGAIST